MPTSRSTVTTFVLALASLVWAVPAAASGVVVPGSAPRSAPGRDGWRWPVPGGPRSVAHGFAPPRLDWLPGHRGVDLRAPAGSVVRSAGAGVVRFADRIGGIGVVSVRHADGLVTTYEPVRPSVHRGDPVDAGTPIGRLTLTGSHCPPAACLHWGLRRGEDYLDPLALLGAARVRLLPLYPPGGPLAPPVPVTAAGLMVTAAAVRSRRVRRRWRGDDDGRAGRRRDPNRRVRCRRSTAPRSPDL